MKIVEGQRAALELRRALTGYLRAFEVVRAERIAAWREVEDRAIRTGADAELLAAIAAASERQRRGAEALAWAAEAVLLAGVAAAAVLEAGKGASGRGAERAREALAARDQGDALAQLDLFGAGLVAKAAWAKASRAAVWAQAGAWGRARAWGRRAATKGREE